MRLATYRTAHGDCVGVVDPHGHYVLDLAAAAEAERQDPSVYASMQALIEAGPAALDLARELDARFNGKEHSTTVAHVKLLAPIPIPAQIRDFSVFPMHVKNAPRGMQRILARRQGDEAAASAAQGAADVPQAYRDRPIYYITNRFSVAGPEETVRWPRYSEVMDFELEIAAILGPCGANISKQDARKHIFGYTIFNDFSARDRQIDEMQGRLGPTKGKSFDLGNAMGPWIITADEIDDPYSLAASVRVNGDVWTTTSTADMLHSFEDMIAYVSEDETLYAGEVFGSGTMNNGCGLEIDRFLKDGDMVELEVEKIGVLRNKVVRQK